MLSVLRAGVEVAGTGIGKHCEREASGTQFPLVYFHMARHTAKPPEPKEVSEKKTKLIYSVLKLWTAV